MICGKKEDRVYNGHGNKLGKWHFDEEATKWEDLSKRKELQKRIEHALCYTGDKPNILTVGYEHASLYY